MSEATLVLVNGVNAGDRISLAEPTTIGRNPDNRVHVDDPQVSRIHARIDRDARGYILRDLNSGNGTYVGARRILEYRLQPNDVIRMGALEFRFEWDTPGLADSPSGTIQFADEVTPHIEGTSARQLSQTFFSVAEQLPTNESDVQQAQKRLRAIYAANQIISTERNLDTLFERVMEQVFGLVPAHNGVIMLSDPDDTTSPLREAYARTEKPGEKITISSSIVHRAIEEAEAVITSNARVDPRFAPNASVMWENIGAAMCVPMLYQDECLGVIYVDTRGATGTFGNNELELLAAIAAASAIAIRNARYVEEIERAYEDTLLALSNAIELRDHYTVGHTWRVTNFTLEICEELGWSDAKLQEVRMGGVLHDVGKIAVPDAILRKPGPLDDDEYDLMKIHPERGAQLLRNIPFLRPLIPYCLYHHERVDGRGYPYGLTGDNIPIEGRVVAVADAFDALTSNRPYRKGKPPEEAIAEVERCSGTQFDPECAAALIRRYRAGRIDRILQDYHKTDEKSIACPYCSTHIRIPEGAQENDVFTCSVCHSSILLQVQNGAYFGKLQERPLNNARSTPRVGAPTPTTKP